MATEEGVMQDVAKQTVSSPNFSVQKSGRAFKLAEREAQALLRQEPADSGIDSEDTDSECRDERRQRQNDDSLEEESDVTVEIDVPIPWNYCAQHPNGSLAEQPVRVSPSLFEVELTASEEDDASVLELIIPYQKPRYQKLPTASPLKTKIRATKYFCGVLCCFCK